MQSGSQAIINLQKICAMNRIAFTMRLLSSEYIHEYKKRHDEIWPGLKTLLKEKGIGNYAIFLDRKTLTLFAHLEIENIDENASLATYGIMQKWWAFMADIMETNNDMSPVVTPLEQMFFLP
jgi:L-rhamnose mutarotase